MLFIETEADDVVYKHLVHYDSLQQAREAAEAFLDEYNSADIYC